MTSGEESKKISVTCEKTIRHRVVGRQGSFRYHNFQYRLF